jgi:hypothetical protein
MRVKNYFTTAIIKPVAETDRPKVQSMNWNIRREEIYELLKLLRP